MSARAIPALVAGLIIALSPEPAVAVQEWSFEGSELLVTNFAGEVVVRGHDDSRIVVRAKPSGVDSDLLDFQVKPDGRAEFHVVYPLGQSREFHHPRNYGSESSFRLGSFTDESRLLREIYSEFSDRTRIEIGGDDGLDIHADLEVLVPRGVSTRIKLAVGEIRADNVEASLDLDTHSGGVRADNIRGDTRVDTGSGSVRVAMIRGSVNIDTGSGSVQADDLEGDDILIDTGSGRVEVNNAKSRSLSIDTGSGSVRTANIEAVETSIDTGSGSVTLDLVRLGDGHHKVDTGSGRVTIRVPSDASVRVRAETGSGGISLDLPDAKLRRMSRDEVELEIGDGRAVLDIETGSGGVKIERR